MQINRQNESICQPLIVDFNQTLKFVTWQTTTENKRKAKANGLLTQGIIDHFATTYVWSTQVQICLDSFNMRNFNIVLHVFINMTNTESAWLLKHL